MYPLLPSLGCSPIKIAELEAKWKNEVKSFQEGLTTIKDVFFNLYKLYLKPFYGKNNPDPLN